MGHRFDTLAKTLSGNLSRREAFWRFSGGLAAAVFASLGLRRADSSDCGSRCAACCKTQVDHPLGRLDDLAACIQACHHGLGYKDGTCGPQVCRGGIG